MAPVAFDVLCQSEVAQERSLALLHENVARLEVAVDHALLVGVVNGIADLLEEFERVVHRQLARLHVTG